MSNTIALACSCGSVKGEIQVTPGSFFHVQCLCCDCQDYATHLDQQTIMDEHGGTDLFQTYPMYMQITKGQDKIACIQLREKGLYRWHTTCCNMPVANTMSSSKIPFVGIPVKLLKFNSEQEKMDLVGPVAMKAFGKYAIGEMPSDAHHKFPISYMPKILGFMIKGLIGKKNTPSPFFNGQDPIAEVNVLSK